MIKEQYYDQIKSSNKPSFYADPLGWGVVDFLNNNFSEIKFSDNEDTGLIVVSDYCTEKTMKNLYPLIKNGKMSPLKFAGANPGVLAGLPAIIYGLRGATIMLSMDPKYSLKPIYSMVKFLFENKQVSLIYIILHEKIKEGDLFRGVRFNINENDNILETMTNFINGALSE